MIKSFDFDSIKHFVMNIFSYIVNDSKIISLLVSFIFLFILYIVLKKFIKKLSSTVKYYFYISSGLSSVNILTTILSYFTVVLPFGINNLILNLGSLITLLIGLWKMKKELEQLGI